MTFQFRLATLLKLREQVRDERRRDLAQAFEAERILRERQSAIEIEIVNNRDLARRLAQATELRVDELANTRRYEAVLKMQVATVQQQLVQVLEEVERRRTALLEADRDVKALDKLHERQAQQYNLKQEKREDQQLDEAALRGFVRKREAAL
jgi:flagellar FliJ protein